MFNIFVTELCRLAPHQGALVTASFALLVLNQLACDIGRRLPCKDGSNTALTASAMKGDATRKRLLPKLDGRGLSILRTLYGGHGYDTIPPVCSRHCP